MDKSNILILGLQAIIIILQIIRLINEGFDMDVISIIFLSLSVAMFAVSEDSVQ